MGLIIWCLSPPIGHWATRPVAKGGAKGAHATFLFTDKPNSYMDE